MQVQTTDQVVLQNIEVPPSLSKKKVVKKKTSKKKEGPITRALAVERRNKFYKLVEYVMQDDKVIEVVVSEDMMRSEVFNAYKIRSARLFMNASQIKPDMSYKDGHKDA